MVQHLDRTTPAAEVAGVRAIPTPWTDPSQAGELKVLQMLQFVKTEPIAREWLLASPNHQK